MFYYFFFGGTSFGFFCDCGKEKIRLESDPGLHFLPAGFCDKEINKNSMALRITFLKVPGPFFPNFWAWRRWAKQKFTFISVENGLHFQPRDGGRGVPPGQSWHEVAAGKKRK